MKKHAKQARGFTLIEILAATGIMTVVILIVLSLTTNVLSVWNKSTGQLTSNYEARIALDVLETDLGTMVLRNRDFCWVQVKYEEPKKGDLEYTDAIPKMPELYFLARVEDRPRYSGSGGVNSYATNTVYGDICAVAYRMVYQDPVTKGTSVPTDFPMFGLYRFVVDSESTFTDIMSQTSDTPGVPLELYDMMDANKFGYIDETGLKVPKSSSPGVDSLIVEMENFLAAGIVDLSVIFWYSTIDSTTGQLDYRAITNTGDASGTPLDFIYTDRLIIEEKPGESGTLEFVDISLTVISPEGMSIMHDVDKMSGSIDVGGWHDLVAQYGQTYTRRVQIMAKPL